MTSDQCVVEGCDEPRYVWGVKRPQRSQYCHAHFKEARSLKTRAIIIPVPNVLTPEGLLALWDNAGEKDPPLFSYRGCTIWGIRVLHRGYDLVLRGWDEPEWVASTTELKRLTADARGKYPRLHGDLSHV